MIDILAETILDHWFGTLHEDGTADEAKSQRWFRVDADFDTLLRKRYSEHIDPALSGAFERWAFNTSSLTALILLLDQFPRNIYRGQPRAFYYDLKALALSLQAVEKELHLAVPAAYAHFMLLPTMHSERLEIQDICLREFERLVANHQGAAKRQMEAARSEAQRHRGLIERFGRFPHRNAILGRTSTPEELAFLQDKG